MWGEQEAFSPRATWDHPEGPKFQAQMCPSTSFSLVLPLVFLHHSRYQHGDLRLKPKAFPTLGAVDMEEQRY